MTISCRCDANPNDLNGPNSTPWTRERTTVLLRDRSRFTMVQSWDRSRSLGMSLCYDASVGIFTDTSQLFTVKFPQANIHELLSPNLLHQLIKGAFNDHLVQWVEDYLKLTHGPSKGEAILDKIDRWYVRFQLCSLSVG